MYVILTGRGASGVRLSDVAAAILSIFRFGLN